MVISGALSLLVLLEAHDVLGLFDPGIIEEAQADAVDSRRLRQDTLVQASVELLPGQSDRLQGLRGGVILQSLGDSWSWHGGANCTTEISRCQVVFTRFSQQPRPGRLWDGQNLGLPPKQVQNRILGACICPWAPRAALFQKSDFWSTFGTTALSVPKVRRLLQKSADVDPAYSLYPDKPSGCF